MLSPKEKAVELVEMFMNIKKQKLADYSIIYYPTAKQCALIAVNEIIYNNLMEYPQHSMIYTPHKNDYWQQVKQEIEQL
jgi:CBS-domain-containing membrane protein